MRCWVVLSLLIFANLSCNSEPGTSIAEGNRPPNSTEEEFLSTRSPSSVGEDSSLKSADEIIDLIQSSTNDETEKLPPPIPFDPPLTTVEINGILNQCLEQILTSADFKRQREFYGTPGSKDVLLVNSSKTAWPANFQPKVKGYDLRFAKSNSVDLDGNRILGIRLEKLEVTAPNSGLFDGNITFVLSNVGGTKNGAVIGGCLIHFTVHRQDDTYVAAFSGSFDP